MKAVIDVWRDITTLSDLDAAKQIMADQIDVLIDVNGYTKLARTKIFSYRPAPVIVNFCGYPGTMASPVHQYIIADEQIIPPGNEVYYTEKVLHIPCNQPVDRKRVIGPRPTARNMACRRMPSSSPASTACRRSPPPSSPAG